MSRGKRTMVLAATVTALAAGGVAMAAGAVNVTTGTGGAALSCPGGMSRLGHVFDENASVFPGDPKTKITIDATIERNGYLVEKVTTGVHTGTHIDSPGHFIAGGRTIDKLRADEFVWPAYVIDVRPRLAASADKAFQLTVADIQAYEAAHGQIRPRSMVIIQTGFDARYGTAAYFADAPGFSGAAVQWMVDNRNIGGVGSDTLGPDATSDGDFLATTTILANDRVAMPDIDNVDSLSIRNDVIIASAVPLKDGSGYQTDPLACHGARDR